ncbi:MAG: mechanosensitive ion channel family protein, partial [Clostridia bacterium]|nr:mechanosensitive ion channel family protein [Clostridia bacterium]
MFKFLKSKSKKERVNIIIVGCVVFVTIMLAILSDVIFPNSQFALIVENSIGKFFNIVGFFEQHYVTILESATILFFVWLLDKLLTFLLFLLIKKGGKGEMIGELFKSIIKYISFAIATFLILSAWGVETRTLLAGAGIIALAVSFGAQSLIEDIISGLFIIFEKQFKHGDVIEINGFRGTVISLGIRVTKLEDINGDIKLINNSDIRGAINTSSHLSPAICDISISYNEDIKKVEELIIKNLPNIKEKIKDIEEGPYYRGVQSLADSGVVIRIYAKTQELKRYQVTRDLNREMKILFDENHIGIPFNQ